MPAGGALTEGQGACWLPDWWEQGGERRGLSEWLPPKLASGCRGAFGGPEGRPSPGAREYTGFEKREFREARGAPGVWGCGLEVGWEDDSSLA